MSPDIETEPAAQQRPVVIVGAGLAGLAAAVLLHRRGRPVSLLEAGDGVGGRVRSDRTPDGFILDRGFQLLCTAYPALTGLVDAKALDLRAFAAGALIAGNGPRQIVVDPFAHPLRLPQLLFNSPFRPADAWRLLRLKLELIGPGGGRLPAAAEHDAATELANIGFSPVAVERFFRPFFGGLVLDRTLQTRAPWFLFLFKMVSEGRMAVPSAGIGALAANLAAQLPADAIQLHTSVDEIERDPDGGVRAVRAGRRRYPASVVILAADLWSARLLDPELPELTPLSCTTIYFRSDRPLYRQRLTVLNPDPSGFLHQVTQLTNVAPSYAPPGQHLLSCSTLRGLEYDDAAIEQSSRTELAQWFGDGAKALGCLAIYRIPHAQFRQPPHWRDHRPNIRTEIPGLYRAGEYMQSSSIQGALLSGIEAARAVEGDLPRSHSRAG